MRLTLNYVKIESDYLLTNKIFHVYFCIHGNNLDMELEYCTEILYNNYRPILESKRCLRFSELSIIGSIETKRTEYWIPAESEKMSSSYDYGKLQNDK